MLSKEHFERKAIENLTRTFFKEPSIYYENADENLKRCNFCKKILKQGNCKGHLITHVMFYEERWDEKYTITQNGLAKCKNKDHPAVAQSRVACHSKACGESTYKSRRWTPTVEEVEPKLQKKMKGLNPGNNRSFIRQTGKRFLQLARNYPGLGDAKFMRRSSDILREPLKILQEKIEDRNQIITHLRCQLTAAQNENAEYRERIENLIRENQKERQDLLKRLTKEKNEHEKKLKELNDIFFARLKQQEDQRIAEERAQTEFCQKKLIEMVKETLVKFLPLSSSESCKWQMQGWKEIDPSSTKL